MEGAGTRQISSTDLVRSALVAQARADGYNFVDRLVSEWLAGTNQFSAPGEQLLGIYQDARLIAIGGLNQDPYLPQPRVGRLRHIYVLPEHRRSGIGRQLISNLLKDAGDHFDRVRLRTASPDTNPFYQSLGFQPSSDKDATHDLWLS